MFLNHPYLLLDFFPAIPLYHVETLAMIDKYRLILLRHALKGQLHSMDDDAWNDNVLKAPLPILYIGVR
jgi:hypothetical protein